MLSWPCYGRSTCFLPLVLAMFTLRVCGTKGIPGCKVLHAYLLAGPYQAVPIPASERGNMT